MLEIYFTGSPLFMAPEIKSLYQDESKMINLCKADIYSLGITILKLLAPNLAKQQ